MNNSTEGTKGRQQWLSSQKEPMFPSKGGGKKRFYSEAGVWTKMILILNNLNKPSFWAWGVDRDMGATHLPPPPANHVTSSLSNLHSSL